MPDPPPEPRERLGHARERLGEAESLLEEGFLEPAVHAAYYAIFHGAMGANDARARVASSTDAPT